MFEEEISSWYYQHCDLVFIKELILCKCILILLVFTHLYTLTGDICCFHSFKKLLPNRSCCSRLPWIPSHPFPPLKNLIDFFSILVVHCTILLTCIPVQKSLPAEHCCELLRNSLEDFLKHNLMKGVIKFLKKGITLNWWHLYGSGVANKCCSHGKPARRDVTDGHLLHMIFFSFQNSIDIGAFSIEHLDIVWNPFNKIGRVLVLNCQHLKYPTDKNLKSPTTSPVHQLLSLTSFLWRWQPLWGTWIVLGQNIVAWYDMAVVTTKNIAPHGMMLEPMTPYSLVKISFWWEEC